MPTGTHTSPIQQTEADISAFINSFADSTIPYLSESSLIDMMAAQNAAIRSAFEKWPATLEYYSDAFLIGMEAAQNATIRRAFEKWSDTLEFFALRITISKAFVKSFQRGLVANQAGEKTGSLHKLVGSYLPTAELRALTSTKSYGAYKPLHKNLYNRVLLRVLTNPPTEEAIREHLFLGTILLALAGEKRYFHTLWRSARLVYDFMHTPARQLQKQALPLF